MVRRLGSGTHVLDDAVAMTATYGAAAGAAVRGITGPYEMRNDWGVLP